MDSTNRFNTNGSHFPLRSEREARGILAAGNRIGAIQTLRVANGLSLFDAKQIVDRWASAHSQRQRIRSEISAVRQIYDALLSQPLESRTRILSAAATLAGVNSTHLR